MKISDLKKFFTAIWNWILKYPVAIFLGLMVIIAGIFALATGKNFNAGSALKTVFGMPRKLSSIEIANSLPDEREITLDEPDKNGWTQWKVKEFKTSKNPLRDKSCVLIINSDGSTSQITLPVGIQDKDISEIIEVKPEVYVASTGNSSTRNLLNSLPTP
jgi:hypothetical protein